eukprot:TRINITY_DN15102_c0_g2_i6.p1 TRINITY_DN15102_c0_g2~~TRINITY_DN15102_c0_g2_i6.p1  ORF type:complete len:493 (+),score=78.09 TRINITY_DN15102_c0_g2_i6:247-1725(+)
MMVVVGIHGSVSVLHVANQRWESFQLNTPSTHACAAAVAVGPNILVFGGCDHNGRFSNKALALDVTTMTTHYIPHELSRPFHTVVPRVRSSLVLSEGNTEIFLFGGCDEQATPLGDLHRLMLVPLDTDHATACWRWAKRSWKLVCEVDPGRGENFTIGLHALEFPAHSHWRRACQQTPWKWAMVAIGTVLLAALMVYAEIMLSGASTTVLTTIGMMLGWLYFFLAPLHHGDFPVYTNDELSTVLMLTPALQLYASVRIRHLMYATANLAAIVFLSSIISSSDTSDSTHNDTTSWLVRLGFLAVYAFLIPFVCLYHEFWIRRFCVNYSDAAHRALITAVLYVTIGIPVAVALVLAFSVGAVVSREYFVALRSFERRNLLPLCNQSGMGCMGAVTCRSDPPVGIACDTWLPHWRRCAASEYQGDGGTMSYCCWKCAGAWRNMNRELMFYEHSESDFRLAGKPSEISAVDMGVHAAAVMQVAHISLVLLASTMYL